MRLNISIVQYRNLTDEQLHNSIDIKCEHWSYTFEEQVRWMQKNLSPDDLHLLLEDNEKLVGYMNLVNLVCECNDLPTTALGVGNVCVTCAHRNLGLGELLLSSSNHYALAKGHPLLLLCKKELIAYYKKFGWKLITPQLCEVGGKPLGDDAFLMGRNWTLEIDTIRIDRYF